MTLIKLTDLWYSYMGRFPAINGIDLEIPAASRVALIGSNGSGKSTLLKLLDALYFPSRGSIVFDGNEITEQKMNDETLAFAFRRRVGFLFQDPEVQLFSPTVWDEICFGPLQMQWEKEKIRQKAEEILEEFGIAELRDRPPYRLSLGEQKKVALASVLILDPEVLLLDEPTAALDPRTQSVLLELLHGWAGRKKTIVISTHDLSILREISDKVYVMNHGKIVFEGTADSVLANSALLVETNLSHQHTHKHDGLTHSHTHTHGIHAHSHEDE